MRPVCPLASFFYSLLVEKVKIIFKSLQNGMQKPGMTMACTCIEGSGQEVAQLFTKSFGSGHRGWACEPFTPAAGNWQGEGCWLPFSVINYLWYQ